MNLKVLSAFISYYPCAETQKLLHTHLFRRGWWQLDESNRSEQVQVQRCRARLDHLSMLQRLGGKENEASWNNTRVQRILIDYMLRSSYYDTALKLTESNNLQVSILSFSVSLSLLVYCHSCVCLFLVLLFLITIQTLSLVPQEVTLLWFS